MPIFSNGSSTVPDHKTTFSLHSSTACSEPSVVRIEPAPGIWPAALHLGGAVLVAAAIVRCGAPFLWKGLLALAAAYVCWMDWRYRPRCIRLEFERAEIRAELAGGRILVTAAPFTSRIAPGFVSIRFRSGWRDRWLTLFRDQLPDDVMRRLRQVLVHGTGSPSR